MAKLPKYIMLRKVNETKTGVEYQVVEELPTQINASNTLKALTNGDMIRQMTDEELAEWMAKYCERKTVFCPNFGAHDCQESCEQCWLDWLRTEVTE